MTVNRYPCSDNELANKKLIDDNLGGNTVLRKIQTLQQLLNVSVANSVYNFKKRQTTN